MAAGHFERPQRYRPHTAFRGVREGADGRLAGGHSYPPVALSPDGVWTAVGDAEAVEIWESMTGRLHAVLRGHSADVTGVAFAPSGRWLVSCGGDATIRVWNLITASEAVLHRVEQSLRGCLVMPDGRGVAVIGAGGLYLLDAVLPSPTAEERHRDLQRDRVDASLARGDDAVAEASIGGYVDDPWFAEPIARLLRRRGDVDELSRRADAGDMWACRELAALGADHSDNKELQQRSGSDNLCAAFNFSAFNGRDREWRIRGQLRHRLEAGDWFAGRQLFDHLKADATPDELVAVLEGFSKLH